MIQLSAGYLRAMGQRWQKTKYTWIKFSCRKYPVCQPAWLDRRNRGDTQHRRLSHACSSCPSSRIRPALCSSAQNYPSSSSSNLPRLPPSRSHSHPPAPLLPSRAPSTPSPGSLRSICRGSRGRGSAAAPTTSLLHYSRSLRGVIYYRRPAWHARPFPLGLPLPVFSLLPFTSLVSREQSSSAAPPLCHCVQESQRPGWLLHAGIVSDSGHRVVITQRGRPW